MFRKQIMLALGALAIMALAGCGAPAQSAVQPGKPTAAPTVEVTATDAVSPLPTPAVAESPLGSPVVSPTSLPELLTALESAGAVVEVGNTVEQPFFEVQGQELKVNGQSVQAFEWADETSREAVSRTISPEGQFGTTMVEWVGTPHFWASGKLIVLYVGDNSEVVDLLTRVLGAPITKS